MNTKACHVRARGLLLTLCLCIVVDITQSPTAGLCQSACVCSTQTSVICTGTDICPRDADPSVSELTLIHASPSSPCGASLNGTSLIHLTNLRKLFVRSYHYMRIQDRAFAGLSSLSSLKIYENGLTRVTAESFYGLEKLNELDLFFNNLNLRTNDTFKHLTGLKLLKLQKNKVQNLGERTFTGLEKLYLLDLSANEISAIHTDAFRPLKSLKSVVLSYNKLATLPEYLFFGSPVATITIESNLLSSIKPTVFANSTPSVVNLANNDLTRFPKDSITEILSSLQILVLDFNHITKLSSGDVSVLNPLVHAAAGSINPLAHAATGGSMHSGVKIYLRGNPLGLIEPGAFAGSKVAEVDLQGTRLTTLSPALDAEVRASGMELQLGGLNGWRCDCDSLWLVDYLIACSECSSPACTAGILLNESRAEVLLQCMSTTTTTTNISPSSTATTIMPTGSMTTSTTETTTKTSRTASYTSTTLRSNSYPTNVDSSSIDSTDSAASPASDPAVTVPPENKNASPSLGLIVGSIVGGIVVFVVTGLIVLRIIHAKNRNRVYARDSDDVNEAMEEEHEAIDKRMLDASTPKLGAPRIAWAKKHWWDEA